MIVEGVQIGTNWLSPGDKDFYRDKPIMILGTDKTTSIIRRQERNGYKETDLGLDNVKGLVNTYLFVEKNLGEMMYKLKIKESGKKFAEEYFKNH